MRAADYYARGLTRNTVDLYNLEYRSAFALNYLLIKSIFILLLFCCTKCGAPGLGRVPDCTAHFSRLLAAWRSRTTTLAMITKGPVTYFD